ncbi:uncharacterized protein LOC124896673 [Capsicum annuum]|uniref:uncharacterized protein LOC124896673 n=1 Tax=Capsicum annuum TaxID=4072 RepID=UPI001FB088CC|nr:uncharacterized protein LOC124896673 [Capsicum annuum]
MESILEAFHAYPVVGHYASDRTIPKVLQSGYYWLMVYKDTYDFVKKYDQCQRQGSITKQHEMPMTKMMGVELFYIWGIDFMGMFLSSYGYKYILVAMDYVSKWVETVALADDEGKRVVAILKKSIFSYFGVPWTSISDGGSNFCNKVFQDSLIKYGVKQQKVDTSYHPQTSGGFKLRKQSNFG